jgi:hypothetical protein
MAGTTKSERASERVRRHCCQNSKPFNWSLRKWQQYLLHIFDGSTFVIHLRLKPLNCEGEVWKSFEQSVIKMSVLLLFAVWTKPVSGIEESTSVAKNWEGSLIIFTGCLDGRRDFLVDYEVWKTFQNLKVSSAAALATVVPSGLRAKWSTRLVCPRRSAIFFIWGYFQMQS